MSQRQLTFVLSPTFIEGEANVNKSAILKCVVLISFIAMFGKVSEIAVKTGSSFRYNGNEVRFDTTGIDVMSAIINCNCVVLN